MLKLNNITRKISERFSLSDINLEVEEGSYFVLLGRSGAGKTQLLELIAGLEKPDTGSVILDGVDITRKKIQERRIGIVFQDHAIFPHMSVFGNIAYPLRSAGMNADEISNKVKEAAAHVNIMHLLGRQVNGLSGGEKQRIAIARTLVRSPRLLLLDEPLSSLDASLRDSMRRLLRKLNREGHTIIHITHDYADAISLARRVGVIHNGKIIQEGPVNEVFSNPANRFVARYAGYKNFFSIKTARDGETFSGITKNGLKIIIAGKTEFENCLAVLKDDRISVSRIQNLIGPNAFNGVIEEIIPTGNGSEMAVNAGDTFYISVKGETDLKEGDNVTVSFKPEDVVIISGQRE